MMVVYTCFRKFHLYNAWILILLLHYCVCYTNELDSSSPQDYLLCRQCGSDVADSNYLFDIRSPLALRIGNKTISSTPAIIQVLENPLKVSFNVITLRKAACVGTGDWNNNYSWFPGFAWKLCVCKHYSHHVGWIFEPFATAEKSQNKASEKGFYALIFDNLVAEEFSNSLIITPKDFKS